MQLPLPGDTTVEVARMMTSDVNSQHATGREEDPNSSNIGRIVQLDTTVVNRIAAGEVIVRPANALKELLENSIDAGSTCIAVMTKAGGMKMLRIEDNGHGIRFADLPILCERFTTSKLRKYEDLESISTFGFRGEALASISHVAHVTVTTMTEQDVCAHTAHYADGKLVSAPRPCAGTRGTTLVVEDLFFNNPTRRQALGKDSIEHAKILEVVQKYAIHYPAVSFLARKVGSSAAELHTVGGPAAKTPDAIGTIYGSNLANELLFFETSSEDPKFRCEGYASGPNWTTRSCQHILFINHRLVECSSLRRAVEAVYAPVLPRHQHPWVYLALELDPTTVDVNVHPTKSEVQFLHEEFIAQRIQEALSVKLRECGGSRTFSAPLPTFSRPSLSLSSRVDGMLAGTVVQFQEPHDESGKAGNDVIQDRQSERGPAKKVELNPTRVRTDHRQRSLDSVWRAGSQVEPRDSESPDVEKPEKRRSFEEAQQLTSIVELKASVALASDAKLSTSLNKSVFVGPVTRELALLQCGAVLCIVNIARLARECAYQRLLRRFGCMDSLVMKDPLPISKLLRLGISDPESGYDQAQHANVNVDAFATEYSQLLAEKAEMLQEYLALRIEDGMLLGFPNVLGVSSDAGLCFDVLPLFLLRLCVEGNWAEEKPCFENLCRILSDCFVEFLLPSTEDIAPDPVAFANELNAAVDAGGFSDVGAAAEAASRKRARTSAPNALERLRWLHEAIRRDCACQWPSAYARDGTVLELVSLDQLYRIFERC
mmetsp:Transcript_13521/g.29678  ORF Transcript_13521/g.29678 Transcript_13521/m.29678 type:complete len:771 (-) Transcript_13521:98-2410(-)